MKVVFISDTHGQHKGLRNLPNGDVICHTGDYSPRGTQQDLEAFLSWFSSLTQYKYRVFISGNHDLFAQDSPAVTASMIPSNVYYLFDTSIILDGIKFYGTSWQPIFLDWAFNLSEEMLVVEYAKIPDDTDVLLTHCPPLNILDLAYANSYHPAKNCGSLSLLDRVKQVNPIINAFGHIHEGYGEISLYNNINFANSSVLNSRYQLVNDPIIINVVK